MKNYEHIAIQSPQIFLPKPGIDLTKWAVVACDQYTSEPEYWDQVKQIVGSSPSTFNLILPEIYLGTLEEDERTQRIQETMRAYLQSGVLTPFDGMVYLERQVGGKTRRGLMLCLDLEQYDFNKGSKSLIRPTEGTIVERLWPRIRIREKAIVELTHILVLIDDPERTVIEPLAKLAGQPGDQMVKRYDLDLMMDSGHLVGYQVVAPRLEANVVRALAALADPETFRRKYGLGAEENVLLYAIGDGNHSLATAKTIWERLKPQVGMDHLARYALVEIENVHDGGLEFEPIHRVLFNLKQEILPAMRSFFGDNFEFVPSGDTSQMIAALEDWRGEEQVFGLIDSGTAGMVKIRHAHSNLAVGTLQSFLDAFLKAGGAEKIDYVHGADVVGRLGKQAGNAGFYLPGIHKNDLFKTVILDGALPRKTFSMGEAREKRFYMESRKIT
jgi:hypothetical protein